MGRKLASNVHLTDDEGNAHVFGPDDDVPAWAEKKISNKSAWAEDDTKDDAKAESRPASSPPAPPTRK